MLGRPGGNESTASAAEQSPDVLCVFASYQVGAGVELVLGGRGFEALRARLGLRKPNTRPVFVP